MTPQPLAIPLWLKLAFLTALPLCALGCEPPPSGLSGAGEGYARYVSTLYNEPAVNHGPRSIEFPVNVAVAQVGQAAPFREVVERLTKAPDVFRRVGTLPLEMERGDRGAPELREMLPRLQAMARDQGADYLLISATTVNTHVRVTPAAGLDLTIVGAFVVPSREIEADANASAAMIDVRSGTIVLTASSQAGKTRAATCATVEAEMDRAGGEAAGASLRNLSDQLLRDARERLANENVAETK